MPSKKNSSIPTGIGKNENSNAPNRDEVGIEWFKSSNH
jgi:hypothetical protein